ncbi:MAG TPA: hypothetical protein P5141_10765 [Candidatus Hydrogenedentes bacterium]|nr:hypothetical protein [Candidatus Hydrogenedentota bacterium]HOC74119.1 hypothetical protein [Candidatus Hydrogenedentota bacterium]HOH51426.1 hypothetical protein [Candidatus Hydrogenedentota bacterium]HRZ18032.1 hypothetical protein [Candidatus Hydrogenedentota bacterium]HRZ81621.1 hypothetical protein [Candidatus Hydrogenedentota bacterium]
MSTARERFPRRRYYTVVPRRRGRTGNKGSAAARPPRKRVFVMRDFGEFLKGGLLAVIALFGLMLLNGG